MHGSFLNQGSSTSKQIWFQAAVDACATTWTGPSTAPEMAAWFVPENVSPFLCTHVVYTFAKLRGNNLEAFERNDESTDWSCKLSSETAAIVVAFPMWCTHLCCVPQRGHPVHYMQLYVDMHDAFHRVRGLHVWNHAIYCCCWCGHALWQMHTVGWEDCVCPFFKFFIYLLFCHLCTHTVLGGLSPFL